jgi:hypothetical protein
MESDWALSQLVGMTASMDWQYDLEIEEIGWYNIKISKLGQDKPIHNIQSSIWYKKSQEYKQKLATISFAHFGSSRRRNNKGDSCDI